MHMLYSLDRLYYSQWARDDFLSAKSLAYANNASRALTAIFPSPPEAKRKIHRHHLS